jgi:hypothetical protein
MTTKITLVLSMSLNVALSLVILQNNKKPVSLGDFRDAVAETRPAEQLPETIPGAPAELTPPPAVETPLVEAVPAEAPAVSAVVEAPPPPPVVIANDWAAYKQEMAEDKDVLVSNIFRSETNAQRAMEKAVQRLYSAGKDVLFSCLMPATGGGVFYMIRLSPDAQEIPRLTSLDDLAVKEYVKEVQIITNDTEKEVWGF